MVEFDLNEIAVNMFHDVLTTGSDPLVEFANLGQVDSCVYDKIILSIYQIILIKRKVYISKIKDIYFEGILA